MLVLAASNDRVEAAEMLLEAGADPAAKDCEGRTALAQARTRKRWNLLNRYLNR